MEKYGTEEQQNPDAKLSVFISYSRANAQFVQDLAELLESRGINPLIDRNDISDFEPWWARITSLLEQAHAVIFVITPNWLESEICQKELNLAIELRKRLAPIALDTIPAERVPSELARLNFKQFTAQDSPAVFVDGLISALQTHLPWLREHTRLLGLALHWESGGRLESSLLRAEALRAAQDTLISRPENAEPSPVVLGEFIAASRAAYDAEIALQKEMLERAQIFQSRMLAERSHQFLERGDAVSAALIALEGLPDETTGITRPYVPEVLVACERALSSVREQKIFSHADLFFHDAAFSEDSKRLIATATAPEGEDSRIGLVIWDAESGDILASIFDTPIFVSADATLVAYSSSRHEEDGVGLLRFDEAISQMVPAGVYSSKNDPDLLAVFANLTGWRCEGMPPLLIRERLFLPEVQRQIPEKFEAFRVRHSLDGRFVAATPAPTFSSLPPCAVFHSEEETKIADLTGVGSFVRCIEFSEDGNRLATGGIDQTARIWDATTGASIAELSGHEAEISCVRFSPDGAFLATTSYDNSIAIWNTQVGNRLQVLRGHHGEEPGSTSIYRAFEPQVRFSPDGQRIVSTWKDQTVRVWRLEPTALVTSLPGGQGFGGPIDFSPDGSVLVFADDETIYCVNAESLEEKWSIALSNVSDITFNPDGSVIAACAPGSGIWMLNAVDGEPLGSISQEICTRLAWSRGGDLISCGKGWDGVDVHAVSDGKLVSTFNQGATGYSVSFAAGDGLVASSGDEGFIRVWNPMDGEQYGAPRLHPHSVMDVAFEQVGDRLVTACCDTTCSIWSMSDSDGSQIVTLSGHSKVVNSARFDMSGDRVVTASEDGTVRVWDAAKGTELLRFEHTGSVRKALFSPDGRMIAATGSGGTAVWRTEHSAANLIDRAARSLPRVLTPEQRQAAFLEDDGGTWGPSSNKWPFQEKLWG